MSTEERTPLHETTEAKLQWLAELRDESLHAGNERAVERQRAQGKLLARERAERLCDPGSFVELDRYVRHREFQFGMQDRRPYGDAVVTGYGTIFGRKVFVFSQDFTVFGGSLSEVFAEKICKVMDLALKYGCPVIGINDSGGARIQEGVVSLAGYAEIFWRNVQASGVIPQISLIMGPCAGGAVYSPGDHRLHPHGRGLVVHVHHGPRRGEDGDRRGGDVRGARRRSHPRARSPASPIWSRPTRSPASTTRATCSRSCRSRTASRRRADRPSDPVERESPELDTLIPDNPNKPYDMKQVITAVVDDGHFLELQPLYAENIVCGFARLGGQPVGIVGNQPHVARRRARHRLVDQGRALRPHLRRVQHPARHVRRRAGLPAGHLAGVGRHHPARRQAALRVRRGDGAEAHGDHAQGLRRRLRRHELEAHPRRLQLRLADGRDRGDGPGGRGQHHLPVGAGGERRRTGAPS